MRMKLAAIVLAGSWIVPMLAGPLAARAAAPKDAKEPAAQPKPVIPHAQSKPPGPALSPQEAMAKMELPPGFKVDLVVSEPDLINPTSMTWDDRGRIWVTESVEYPRASAGPGQDRVKILEDTDNDGKIDKVSIFKDGLNIPCGVAIGNGGVYVTNSPDILFLQDTDGDGKADKQEVILTGFGRDDRHELPNSLTWGPDGWLYGMNGVFNQSKVKGPASGQFYNFTCAIWRYHPKTKKFELFSEGTSNPWGLDYNRQGDWFLSCCVIDHLFHMTQSGYYNRQGGPYPANVQMAKLPSITTEKHQQAAYAGLCIYDADVFPEEYRGRLLMGNLHGSCINQDVISRNGSTYTQKNVKDPAAPAERKGEAVSTGDVPGLGDGRGCLDFLQANDAWFMPVSQKIGPDGCVYIMDWYDRYHCYQDANRDAPGLDRLKGRIYRISYGDAPRAKPFDLQKASKDELITHLASPNVWWRRTAQRILNEKFDAAMTPALQKMALDTSLKNNANMHALWLLVSQNALDDAFLQQALASPDAPTRNWGVRTVGQAGKASPAIYEKLKAMAASDPSPDVRVQIAVAAGRLAPAAGVNDPVPLLMAVISDPAMGKDPLTPHIAYMNLRPLAAARGAEILAALDKVHGVDQAFGDTTVRWIRQAINTSGRGADEIVADTAKALKGTPDAKKAAQALTTLIDGLSSVNPDERANAIKKELRDQIAGYIDNEDAGVRLSAVTIAVWWSDAKAVDAARKIVADAKAPIESRMALVKALSDAKVAGNVEAFAALAGDAGVPVRLRQVAVDALGVMNRKDAAQALVERYGAMPPDLKPMAVNALTRSPASAEALVKAMEDKSVPVADVNANHVRAVLALNNADLSKRITGLWGTVKTDRDPERVKIVEQMKKVITSHQPGDPVAGLAVYTKTCAQCHTIYGKGGNVGPDITGVGRENLDAILTNVLDPNLVIGAPYYVNVAKTKGGDVISGLLVERSDTQVVLRDQTKQTVIPAKDLDKLTVQTISMMPEGLEKNMSEQEFCDLVAFLLTREPPKGGGGATQ